MSKLFSNLKSKSTAQLQEGNFIVYNPSIFYKSYHLVYKLSDTEYLISSDARGRMSVSDTLLFDDFLFEARTAKVKLTPVDNFNGFFDPETRYRAFLKSGTVPPGIVLTEDEQKIPAALAELKDKFIASFAVPKKPYIRTTAALGANDKLVIYTEGRTVKKERVKRQGGVYSTTLASADIATRAAIKIWQNYPGVASTERLGSGGYSRMGGYSNSLEVYGDRVKFGCQTFTRAAIEDYAAKRGLLPS